jgi:peptidoglycan DL-endopeptidase LytF
MEQFNYELRKENNDTYALVVFLDNTEFADELGRKPKERSDFLTKAKQIVRERYPNVKVTMLKVIAGGLVVTSIPLSTGFSTNEVHAATNSSNALHHHVQSGDTLWDLSKRYNISVDKIKQANQLTSDFLKVDQELIIPLTSHTVAAGDYLSVLAKKYGTTVEAIKEANGLTSDAVKIGQTLMIPSEVGTSGAAVNTTQSSSTYTVVAGDSLSVIAKRFGMTMDTLKAANNLTSDFLRVGQNLSIPTTSATVSTHTVVAGDSLWDIANKYGTTVNALKSANQLTSDTLQLGQRLTIPTTGETETTNTVTPEREAVDYTVVSGDNLTFIAEKFGVTIDAIRQANNLSTDVLQIGQRLTVPNGIKQAANEPTNTVQENSITYTTHTVASGDNIWDLSVRYGIPQRELLQVNNLTTSSMLSIGQQLKVPVHTIAVKDVVSERHGEYLDWFTEAQYVFPIGKTAKVTDFVTGESFYIKRTIGANHADSETVSVNDTNIAKSVWGGFSWTARAVIVEVDGREIAASMTFMPHDIEYITGNGITGHFDVYFGDSIRHKDGKPDLYHQKQVEIAAGIQGY